MQLQLFVGSTGLDVGEVWIQISKQSLIGQTGYRMIRRNRWDITGVITESGVQADIDTAMGVRESVFGTDGQDLTLKFDDGSNTKHLIVNADTLNGVRFRNFQWLGGLPGQWGSGVEYATVRTYRVVAEADVVDQDGSDLFYWKESVKQIGNGGPETEWPENLIYPPTRQDTKNFTRGAMRQWGTATGFLAYPSPQPPLFPGLLKPKSFDVTYDTPDQFGRQRHSYHTVHWSYLFEADTAILAAPPPLPAP